MTKREWVETSAALVAALEAALDRMNCPNCDEGLCEDCSERFGDVWPLAQAALTKASELAGREAQP